MVRAIYADADLAAVFGPEQLATLKGKSCFYIKRLAPALREQLEAALRAGFDLYVAREWM